MKTKPFLRQVAEHYLERGLHTYLFVFPNKRSIAFFKKYVSDELNEMGGGPVIAPAMMGVSDFFSAMTGRRSADRITLLLKLYESYRRIVPGGESLDDFLYWGDSLLSDFDDVDKYRIEAKALFTNILDLKKMDSSLSELELTDEQRAAILRLSNCFLPENWNKVGDGKLDVKDRFIKVWECMYDLYLDFRTSLIAEGLAYEGMVYRELADYLEQGTAKDALNRMDPSIEKCVFIGLNTLNQCETAVLKALQNEELAEFCWDFSGEMLTDSLNQASHFMKGNIALFPNAFRLDPEGLPTPTVHIVAVPSATAQAKVLHDIIERTDVKERGLDFAAVLPDESMLIPVLSSLPDTGKVNVTMGYPLVSSEWNTLMRSIIALQQHLRDGKYFYHAQVSDIFSNGIFKGILSEDEKESVAAVQAQAKAYIPIADLAKGESLGVLFRPVLSDISLPSANQIRSFAEYLVEVVETIAGRLDREKDALQLECAYKYLQCVRRLAGISLPVLPRTFIRLLEQLVSRLSVPFSGEPLEGLQVMGPLETRALDFKHLVILSANEGVFPGRNKGNSVIPPELRLAFGLPTYELQDTVWAYYFYRMIARSEDVWMVYDSRTEGLSSGEESRYIKQLRYLYPDKCLLVNESASFTLGTSEDLREMHMSPEDVEALKNYTYSASSIYLYSKCPLAFYFHAIKELYAQDDVKEDLDSGMLGTICHDALQAIYCCEEAMKADYFFDKTEAGNPISKLTVGLVTEDFLKGWLSKKDDIRLKINALICHTLQSPKLEGRNLVFADIALKYVCGVLKADLDLLRKHGSMKILGLEQKYYAQIAGRRFKGYIDRIDRFEDGMVRVVDYKTGNDRQDTLNPELGPEESVKRIFVSDIRKYKAALQFHIYDRMVESRPEFKACRIFNSMYSISDLFTREVEVFPMDAENSAAIDLKLESLLDEIENPSIPFTMTKLDPRTVCQYCDYSVICGRATK